MKKRLLFLSLIIVLILSGCSRDNKKATARESRKVVRYLEGFNSSTDGLYEAKFHRDSKTVYIVMNETTVITDPDVIKNGINGTSDDFVELIGDNFSIIYTNSTEDYFIYTVKDKKVIEDKFEDFLTKYPEKDGR